MTARCKFRVESVTHHAYGGRQIKLGAHYDAADKDDRAFSTATPQGSMDITINNAKVFDVFQPGKTVYIDVTPVE